jgi:hypothetical protein
MAGTKIFLSDLCVPAAPRPPLAERNQSRRASRRLNAQFAKIEHLPAFRNVREQHIHEGRGPCVARYPIWFER